MTQNPLDREGAFVDVADPAALAGWSARFGVAPATLRAAVEIVGPMDKALDFYLRRSKHRRGLGAARAALERSRRCAAPPPAPPTPTPPVPPERSEAPGDLARQLLAPPLQVDGVDSKPNEILIAHYVAKLMCTY